MRNALNVITLAVINCCYRNLEDAYVLFVKNDKHIHFVFEAVAVDSEKLIEKLVRKGAKACLCVRERNTVKESENTPRVDVSASASCRNDRVVEVTRAEHESHIRAGAQSAGAQARGQDTMQRYTPQERRATYSAAVLDFDEED